jgi:predicted AAA+ superfamily ATPase
MYLPRAIESVLGAVRRTFPAIVITGPRQSGKSTLLRHVISSPGAAYISLEDPNLRELILENPLGFLEKQNPPVVLDEIQHLPEITIYVKMLIDKQRTPGTWFLTGSQQFSVMKHVSESLAGRAAVLTLLPFNLRERNDIDTVGDFLTRSSFPELIVNKDIRQDVWNASYLQTYLERDLRTVLNVLDLRDFERFMRFIAARTGQLLNYSECSKELGISVPTVKRWVSALEASYIIFLLPPFFENMGKRIVKTPKLYMLDMGLLSYLLRVPDANYILNSPFAGAFFETAVVSEFVKQKYAQGTKPELYFWKSQSGIEIDLIVPEQGIFIPYEIKLSSIIRPQFYRNLRYWLELNKSDAEGRIITACMEDVPLPGNIRNIFWKNL